MYRKISYIFLNIYLFLGFVNYAYSQDKNNTSTIAINNKLELMKNTPQLKNATWGFCAIDCTTGNTIAEYNSNIGLVPASILKIVTTTASLYILGSDFKFLTKLQYTGHINEEGVLNGNLYITGGGDPTLCSDFLPNTIEDSIFYKFYLALLSSNIKQINGNIIGDESIFNWENRIPESWNWEDIGNYYGAGPCGLSYNNNLYKIYLDAGNSIGAPTYINNIKPDIPNIFLINKVKTAAKNTKDNVIIYCSPLADTLCVLTGTIPLGKNSVEVKGANPDPSLTLSIKFYKYLLNKGIKINGKPITSKIMDIKNIIDTLNKKDIYTLYSPPITSIISRINTASDNTYAETLLYMCGLKKGFSPDSKGGILAIKNYWISKGINLNGLKMFDGSGLSRKNYITPNQLALMLYTYTKEPYYTVFYNSLPIAGKTGTIKNMFKNSIAENNLRAKSGNMDGIFSLAGYVTNKSSKKITFTIIINNYSGTIKEIKKIAEDLLILLANSY